ncbi:sugar ABC transporter ATP-binding protein [Micromonospora sp. WMMD1102]|uniref:sugar ABC transporter ATP-binding protein n=1 Tax=Micromonospora sp. WMMD1102 TaxID=3016105 RepID=UPI0024152E7A|nr:sugar ABC transporter ATP-binding protein [Micromonospora sp. WMMD1102]MDG4789161.1 sugar ABC transporter ATP-binding protein [Micromonospora sp. WMMD1102]
MTAADERPTPDGRAAAEQAADEQSAAAGATVPAQRTAAGERSGPAAEGTAGAEGADPTAPAGDPPPLVSAPADTVPGEVVLRLTDVVKTFPGVRALDGVQLEVRAGEVHCLLGQNGAGKSTLIKVLSGAHQPDSGQVEWLGEPASFGNPQAAMKAGIATIYQELDLVDDLSVAENAFLGHEPRQLGFVRRGYMARQTRQILARLGHPEIPPRRMVRSLPSAGKQIVSMARALSHEARLIIMDEPSAVLAHDEVGNLFRIIRELTAQGIAVIYISHRLEEIREIGDRVTVLKDGRTTAANLPARTTPTRDLVSRMTGRTIEYVFPDRPAEVPAADELLQVRDLGREGEFADVSLTVRAGEIVGIAGLVGSGRSELLETIFGARRPTAGTVTMAGRPVRPGSVGAAVRAGMGMAPEERKSQALLLGEPIYRNVTLATFSRWARLGFTDAGRERAEAEEVAQRLELRPRDVRRPVRTLSGGNQQKVVVGRWLLGGTRLLLLDEPTRGVDVGARAELYQVIRALAAQGVGVLLVSSEVPEVLGLADRVLVMREGRVVHEAPAGELDEDTVLDLVMAGSLMEGAPA